MRSLSGGGGGLIAGIAAYVKQLYPKIKIIGVEPEDAAAMYESLRASRRVTLDKVGLFADGVAVRRVGKRHSSWQSATSIRSCWSTPIRSARPFRTSSRTRVRSSSRRALAVAGIKHFVAREKCREQRFVAINSGANMNFDRLRHIASAPISVQAGKRYSQ